MSNGKSLAIHKHKASDVQLEMCSVRVGQTLFGIISAESPASITIKGLEGKETTVLRSAIKSLAGSNRSLMPDGLEATLSKQDIRFALSAPSGN